MKDLYCAAVIQVRMGSKRFPKKSICQLGNFKMIEWVIKRTKKVSELNGVFLATTKKSENKIFKKIAKENNIKIFFGDENNVLKRYCDVAKKYKIKNIVRICADNPFVSPDFLRNLISYYKKNNCDLAFNHTPKKKYKFKCVDGFGAEIFSSESLNKIRLKTKNKKDLEHVTRYFYKSKIFKVKPVPIKNYYKQNNLSLDVDTKKDYLFLKSFIKKKKINLHTSSRIITKSLINY